jgi:hypothetical protein
MADTKPWENTKLPTPRSIYARQSARSMRDLDGESTYDGDAGALALCKRAGEDAKVDREDTEHGHEHHVRPPCRDRVQRLDWTW